MKVACQTCDAKYTISDEKVRGKTVKIKCKKCGTSIIAGEAAAPSGDGGAQWSLNVGDDDTRTATLAEVAELYRDGVIQDDTYVWREGMPDWVPLSSVDELRDAVAGARDEDQPTRMGKVPSAVMRAGKASEPQQAARRTDAPRGRDLFGAPAAATPAPQPQLIDEEQATTAFDAGAMAARAPVARPVPAPTAPAPKEINDGEASGLIDIKLLQNMRGGPPPKPKRDDKLDDLFGVSSSPFDAPAPAPMLMALDLTAPSPPDPPPPAPAPVAAAPTMAAMAPLPQKKSNTGLIIGGLLGVLVLGAAGAGVALVVGKKSDAAPSTSAAATSADKPADDKASEPPKADASAEAPHQDKPADSADAVAAAPTTIPTADAKDAKPKTAAELKKEAAEKKKKEEEAKKKEAEAKAKEADAKAPAGGGGDAPFDRAAALSALGGAAGAAQSCKKSDGPTGSGRATVTFAPSGRVTQAQIDGAFAGTSVGSCIAAKFRGAKIPAFAGSPVTVKKSFSIH